MSGPTIVIQQHPAEDALFTTREQDAQWQQFDELIRQNFPAEPELSDLPSVWHQPILNAECPRGCDRNVRIGPSDKRPHFAALYCLCGNLLVWLPKLEQSDAKTQARKRNADHALRHRQLFGTLCCWICGTDETRIRIEIDHVKPLARGGPDIFENTRAVCTTHHQIIGLLRDQHWQAIDEGRRRAQEEAT